MDQATLDFMRKIDTQLGDLARASCRIDAANAAAADAAIAAAQEAFATIKQFLDGAADAET